MINKDYEGLKIVFIEWVFNNNKIVTIDELILKAIELVKNSNKWYSEIHFKVKDNQIKDTGYSINHLMIRKDNHQIDIYIETY